ncbi:MAG TPA: DUF1045 domain-containing protein [Ramlibacter sp.]|nr:DUF1045 domain-containing protein [Ramlibacter sp.]
MKTETTAPHRCAIYFAPRLGTPWSELGSDWLGRCAATDRARPQPALPDIDAALLRRATEEPRRYGWHATLKAPFAIAPGHDIDDVRDALRELCTRMAPFTLPAMEAVRMGRFLALRPQAPCEPLARVAAACVTELHRFAAPLSDAETQRRRRSGLTPEQDALLLRWGYPWVMQHFRFHLSLTGDLQGVDARAQESLLAAARVRFEALPPCEFDNICLFIEPTPGADFRLVEQMAFSG